MGLYISKEYYLENNAMFCIYSTAMNKRKAEPEQAGGDSIWFYSCSISSPWWHVSSPCGCNACI